MANDKTRDVLDLTSLQLKAKPAPGANRPASLKIATWRNKPSITVFSNVEGAPRYGIFGINLYPYIFTSLISGMKIIAMEPFVQGEKISRSIEVMDKPTNDGKVIGEIVYGRSEDGIMFICLVNADTNFPKIPFMFTPSRQFNFKGSSPQEASRDYALGVLLFWSEVMPRYLIENFVDETKDAGGFGNKSGGGYGNKSGGGYGSAPTSAVSDDEDLPF